MEFHVLPKYGTSNVLMRVWFNVYLPKINKDWTELYNRWISLLDSSVFKVLNRSESGVYVGVDDKSGNFKQCRTHAEKRYIQREMLSDPYSFALKLSFINGRNNIVWTSEEIERVYISFCETLESLICEDLKLEYFPFEVRTPLPEVLYDTLED